MTWRAGVFDSQLLSVPELPKADRLRSERLQQLFISVLFVRLSCQSRKLPKLFSFFFLSFPIVHIRVIANKRKELNIYIYIYVFQDVKRVRDWYLIYTSYFVPAVFYTPMRALRTLMRLIFLVGWFQLKLSSTAVLKEGEYNAIEDYGWLNVER